VLGTLANDTKVYYVAESGPRVAYNSPVVYLVDCRHVELLHLTRMDIGIGIRPPFVCYVFLSLRLLRESCGANFEEEGVVREAGCTLLHGFATQQETARAHQFAELRDGVAGGETRGAQRSEWESKVKIPNIDRTIGAAAALIPSLVEEGPQIYRACGVVRLFLSEFPFLRADFAPYVASAKNTSKAHLG
jgi:hypothetical protein